jgi:hypothetical protein
MMIRLRRFYHLSPIDLAKKYINYSLKIQYNFIYC